MKQQQPDRTNKSNKWTLMKYVSDFNLMTHYALITRKYGAFLDVNSLNAINDIMMEEDTYVPRYGRPSKDTIFFKLCQVVYYMFAYKVGSGDNIRLVYSPLGNLLLDNLDDEKKVAKIFMAMLFNLPFNHPFNHMDETFNIYPFRLLFKLLRDERLNNKLYCDEVFYWVVWTKSINTDSYQELVSNILSLRAMPPHDKYTMFKQTLPQEDTLANALHEVEYMFGHLKGAGIVEYFTKEELVGALHHGGFGRKSIPAYMSEEQLCKTKRSTRNYRLNYIQMSPKVEALADKLLSSYSYQEKPHDLLNMGKQDYIKYLYNFFPEELQKELDIKGQERIQNMWKISNDIKKYSRNKVFGDCYRFEETLCDAFNEFQDVHAELIGHAGNTDVECIYLTIDEKFDLEAKSTENKLKEVKTARLKQHREKIGSKYTIIITPFFVKGALHDIDGTSNVLLTANTLSNYLYQGIIHDGTNFSYKPLYKIIKTSLGDDISQKVNQYVEGFYGVGKSQSI